MNDLFVPAYLNLLKSGNFENIIEEANRHLSNCDCCPRNCGADRNQGQLGSCKTGALASISSYGPHYGEEPPLSGWKGSGTIFFSRCNMHCVYCQNYDISQTNSGSQMNSQEIANIMIKLQNSGCHNINLVSPSHVIPQIIEAVYFAAQRGLHLPIVYNTGGYDSLDMLKLLEPIIDIYMPDMKYSDNQTAEKYSKISDYTEINQMAVKEMHSQVGDLVLDENQIAQRGLLIRHLVLPNQIAGSENIIKFITKELSTSTYLNIMNQYHPHYKAFKHPALNRKVTTQEYQSIVDIAIYYGLHRID